MATRQIKALMYDVYDNAGAAALNPSVSIIDASGGGGFPTTATTGSILFDNGGTAWWRNGNGWVQISASTPEVQMGTTPVAAATAGTIILDTTLQKPVWYTGSKWATLGSAAISSSPFVPSTTDSRIVSWFDAKSITKATNSALVAADIPNKKVGGAALSFGTGTAPVYRFNWTVTPAYTTPGIYLTAVANSFINIPYSLTTTRDLCLIIACTFDSGQYGTLLEFFNSSGTVVTGLTKNNHTPQSGPNPNYQFGGTYSPTQPQIVSIQCSSSSYQFAINGLFVRVFQSPVITTPVNMNFIRLFNGHTGHLFEAIAYNTVLSDTERLKVEGYMAHRWNITNRLVAGHPYKSVEPIM
jgi:hypothetical protein